MGLRTRAVGLGASAATATGLVGWWARARLGLGTRRIRSPRRLRSALGTSARLVAAPLQHWGFSVLPVFDAFYQEWGFWLYGMWIPLPGQP
jgi:hypothetical protein